MSAEEDRLWNIVRANSLDFTAWTALIEETEKVAEVCWHIFYDLNCMFGCVIIHIFWL